MPIDFVRRLFSGSDEQPGSRVLQLFTPAVVGSDRPALRLVVGGITLAGIAVAGAVALSSMLTLIGAILGLYLLLTQVLGLELDFDPRAFVEEARRAAARA
jgi:hypothetical protein